MDQDFGAKNFSLKNQGKDQDLSQGLEQMWSVVTFPC